MPGTIQVNGTPATVYTQPEVDNLLAPALAEIEQLKRHTHAAPPPVPVPDPELPKHHGLMIRQYNEVVASTLDWARNNGVKGVTYIFHAPHRRTSDLSQSELDQIRRSFERVRAAGMFATFRLAYWFHWDGTDQIRLDASPAQAHRHIDQLAEVVNGAKDILLSAEGGIVGKWGEWHYHNVPTQFHTYGERSMSHASTHPRGMLIKKLLRTWQVPIGLRYPTDLRWAIERLDLTEAEKARLVHHNDALLGNSDESGTWEGNADLKRWFYEVYMQRTPRPFMFGEFLQRTDYTDDQLREEFKTLALRNYVAHSYDSGMPIRTRLEALGLWDDLVRALDSGDWP